MYRLVWAKNSLFKDRQAIKYFWETAEHFRKGLKHKSPVVRMFCAENLLKLHFDCARKNIHKLLIDPNDNVRNKTLMLCLEYCSSPDKKILESLLSHSNRITSFLAALCIFYFYNIEYFSRYVGNEKYFKSINKLFAPVYLRIIKKIDLGKNWFLFQMENLMNNDRLPNIYRQKAQRLVSQFDSIGY